MTKCKSCNPNVTTGLPAYYEEIAPGVVENHTQTLNSKCYAAGIKIVESWNIPADGEDIAVSLEDVTNLPVGVYLYNPQYGYLKISQWNPAKGIVGLTNESVVGTAAPGTFVSANTLFLITPKPCCEDDTSTFFPFVSEDFTAPSVGQERTIQVTSTFGLQFGSNVRIGSGVYELIEINSSRQIVIKNNGAGITPGITVEAENADGEYQYLIVAENASACSATTVEEGRLMVCDGNLEKILTGIYADQVPVLIDAAGALVAFKSLDAEIRVCSQLIVAVNITNGNADYTFQIEENEEFFEDDIIQLNDSDLRFIVNTASSTVLTVTAFPTPSENETYTIGSRVCKRLTAESIQEQLDALTTLTHDTTLGLTTGTVRYNRTTAQFEEWNGIAWVTSPLAPPVGSIQMWMSATLPARYLFLTGQTIGNGASGATARANADMSPLFIHLWTSLTNSEAAVSGGRGASAVADFAANKTLTLPDMRQKFPIGKAASGTGSTLGGTGGAIDHSHTGPEHQHTVPAHTHTVAAHNHTGPAHTHASGTLFAGIGFVNSDAQAIRIAASASTFTATNRMQGDVAGWPANTDAGIAGAQVGGATASEGTGVTSSTALTTDAVAAGVTGLAGTNATGTNNPPFMAMNYIIRY